MSLTLNEIKESNDHFTLPLLLKILIVSAVSILALALWVLQQHTLNYKIK
jgi:hypothetical protein